MKIISKTEFAEKVIELYQEKLAAGHDANDAKAEAIATIQRSTVEVAMSQNHAAQIIAAVVASFLHTGLPAAEALSVGADTLRKLMDNLDALENIAANALKEP